MDEVQKFTVTNFDYFLNNEHVSNNLAHACFEKMKRVHNAMMTKLKSGPNGIENGEFEFVKRK
jgi:hypothetical protein